MSQENLEIVLEVIRLFEAKESSQARGYWHSDARMTAPEGWPEPGPFEGWDAILEQLERLTSDAGTQRFRDVKVLADREDWVVISLLWEVHGAGSGAATASKIAAAYRVFDGKLGEAHFRWTPEEALEAAGLSR